MDKARDTLEPSPLQRELAATINRHCAENGSDTPEFVLGRFLIEALQAFDNATKLRDEWWGFQPRQRRPEPPEAAARIESDAERIATLAERAEALHKALRRHAIAGALGDIGGHCRECWGFGGSEWGRSEHERHAEGCLAAPKDAEATAEYGR